MPNATVRANARAMPIRHHTTLPHPRSYGKPRRKMRFPVSLFSLRPRSCGPVRHAMPAPGQPFTVDDIANLLRAAPEVITYWWEEGVGPQYLEQETAQGVERICTAAAVRDFVLKHRVMGSPVKGEKNTNSGSSPPLDSPFAGGGAFSPDESP